MNIDCHQDVYFALFSNQFLFMFMFFLYQRYCLAIHDANKQKGLDWCKKQKDKTDKSMLQLSLEKDTCCMCTCVLPFPRKLPHRLCFTAA